MPLASSFATGCAGSATWSADRSSWGSATAELTNPAPTQIAPLSRDSGTKRATLLGTPRISTTLLLPISVNVKAHHYLCSERAMARRTAWTRHARLYWAKSASNEHQGPCSDTQPKKTLAIACRRNTSRVRPSLAPSRPEQEAELEEREASDEVERELAIEASSPCQSAHMCQNVRARLPHSPVHCSRSP